MAPRPSVSIGIQPQIALYTAILGSVCTFGEYCRNPWGLICFPSVHYNLLGIVVSFRILFSFVVVVVFVVVMFGT
jgi:hypothetical protein